MHLRSKRIRAGHETPIVRGRQESTPATSRYTTPMRSERVLLFTTQAHACGYYADRTARNVVIDPESRRLADVYPDALEAGFRRAGSFLYRPDCGNCHACIPCRIPVQSFEPDRSQRRCLKRNDDVAVSDTSAGFSPERFALYKAYLDQRHPQGQMDKPRMDDFTEFLDGPWSTTRFLEFRHRERLLAVAVTDVTAHSLSAVYTFFDPGMRTLGLGTLAILTQIDWARRCDMPYLYLGYWIPGHPKMDYKRRFRPLEILLGGRWQTLDRGSVDGRPQA